MEQEINGSRYKLENDEVYVWEKATDCWRTIGEARGRTLEEVAKLWETPVDWWKD